MNREEMTKAVEEFQARAERRLPELRVDGYGKVSVRIHLGDLPVRDGHKDYGNGPWTRCWLEAPLTRGAREVLPSQSQRDELVKHLRRKVEDRLRKGTSEDLLRVAAVLGVDNSRDE